MDAAFYRAHNRARLGRIARRIPPAVHFAAVGQWRGLDPSPAFDTGFAAHQFPSPPRSPWWALTAGDAPDDIRIHPMQVPEPRGLLRPAGPPAAAALAAGMRVEDARRRVHPAMTGGRMRDAAGVFESVAKARAGLADRLPVMCDVLMVNGDDHCPPCTQYRMLAPAEALRAAGLSVVVVNASDLHRLGGCDLVPSAAIVFRAFPDAPLDSLMDDLAARGVPMAWDIDDLLFDGARPLGSLQSAADATHRIDDSGSVVTRHRLASIAARCPWHIVPTRDLLAAAVAEGMVAGGVVAPSFLTAEQISVGAAPSHPRRADRDGVVIGYSCGTATHGADFAVAAPALAAVLRGNPRVRLRVFGPLALDGHGLPPEQVEQVDTVVHDWGALMSRMALLDVSIVPLEIDNGFCRAKSEVKYLEAGCVGVPTIATATPAYVRSIEDGVNGRLVHRASGWEDVLGEVVADARWRAAAGARARRDVVEHHGPDGPAARAYVDAVRAMIRGAQPEPMDDWPAVLGAPAADSVPGHAVCVAAPGVSQDDLDDALGRMRLHADDVALIDERDDPTVAHPDAWVTGDSWVDLATALRRAEVIEVLGAPSPSMARLITTVRSGTA